MLHLPLTIKEMSTLLSIAKNKQKKVSVSQFQSHCCETNTTHLLHVLIRDRVTFKGVMSFSQTSSRQGWNKNAYLIETTAEIDSHPCWAKVNSHLRFFAANVFHRCWCVCSLSEPANVKWFRTSLGTRYGSTFYKWQASEEEISLKPGKDLAFHSTLAGLTRTSQLQPAVHTWQLRWRCHFYTFLSGETPVEVHVQQLG